MHPRGLRCSSLKYSRYSRSSRLASGAPRPSRCDARLSPRASMRRLVGVKSGGDITSSAALLFSIAAADVSAPRTCVSGGPSDRTTRLPFALDDESCYRLGACWGPFCGPVLPAASRSLYRHTVWRYSTRPWAQSPGSGFDPSLSARVRGQEPVNPSTRPAARGRPASGRRPPG